MSILHEATVLACMALAVACFTLRVLRSVRMPAPREPATQSRLPLPLRAVAPLGRLLEPLAACLTPEVRLRAVTRTLEVLGLGPGLPAVRWESLCMAQGVAFALVAAACLPGRAWPALLLAAGGYLSGGLWLKRQLEIQRHAIARDLPAWLDLMTVCVEAGATLTAGLRLIVAQAPPGPLRDYFDRVLREVRGGRARAQAFSHVADLYGVESLGTLASALTHAESSGMSLGQVLRAQAEQRTAERFARAEKLAMQAPVKMLGPLILCIFPCTFIVIGVPIAVRLKEALGS